MPAMAVLIARFSDGTVTDDSWRAQSFYIAPLAKPGDVVERGDIHDTSTLGRVYPAAKLPACQERCFAVHYPVPENWVAPDFDDCPLAATRSNSPIRTWA